MIGIIIGSPSDLEAVEGLFEILDKFGIEYEVTISSAHRSLNRTLNCISNFEKRGIEVIVSAAGYAAHLPGVIAAKTTLPVIGIPVDSSPLKGMDSLLSMVQMPPGVPVATMGIGGAGAKNAGIFAAQILSIKYPEIKDKMKKFKEEMEIELEKKGREVEGRLRK